MLIAQISDTHIKAAGKLAYRRVDTAQKLQRCIEQLRQLDPAPDLVVITGDLVDLGHPDEYRRLRQLLAPLSQPIVAIPGNHDERDAMRAAFSGDGYLPASGFLQFAIDDAYPLRIIGLDTLIPGQGCGALCAKRLAWLETTLARRPSRPTLILMHHPPFATGIGHMDALGLSGADDFERLVARHGQVEAILCGHLHRPIQTTVGQRRAMAAPSPAHQVTLDLRPSAPSRFSLEPPGYFLHRWDGRRLVTHHALIDAYEGPYPFFDADGRLID